MSVRITPHGNVGKRFPTGRVVRALLGVNTAVYRLLGGRGMKKMAILTTVGAKSGLRRSLPVTVFTPGAETWWVVASKGGSATHPAWREPNGASPTTTNE